MKFNADTNYLEECFDEDFQDEEINIAETKKETDKKCPNCDGVLDFDPETGGLVCPYCGYKKEIEETEKGALDNFKSWLKRKFFCPKRAKENIKPGKIKGIYLPYWTFDANTSSKYTGKYGIDKHYNSEGKDKVKTDWYITSGHYEEFINDELIIATTNHDNSILRGLEPFNTEDNVSYKPEYVAGFGAERYSIGLKDAFKKAKEFIKSHINSKITEKIKYANNADKSTITNLETVFSNVTYKYLLLPVWVSSFEYNGKVYQFMINGQTGKISGKTPISDLRVLIAIILAAIIIGVIIYFYNK